MGYKKNENKNRAQPVCLSKPIDSASSISKSEKGNTICYICDKRFICPCESERCTKPKERICALASYSNTYPLYRLTMDNDLNLENASILEINQEIEVENAGILEINQEVVVENADILRIDQEVESILRKG
ncbi:13155_t:CDS:2 [Funneliformis geosporum]|nr:13155_t:CDS:2 [Funneliformis geosporum]